MLVVVPIVIVFFPPALALTPSLVVDRSQLVPHAVTPVAIFQGVQGRGSGCASLSDQIDPADEYATQVADVRDVAGPLKRNTSGCNSCTRSIFRTSFAWRIPCPIWREQSKA